MTRRLLIVSSIRWDYLWQRHQALAVAAAEDGWQVDFLQPHPRTLRQVATFPLRRLRGDLLTQDHPAPPAGIRVLGLSAWLRPREHGPYELALVYLPDAVTEWFLRRSGARRVVYDAVLDWASVPSTWFPPIGWRRSERRLAALPSAAVITDAPGMADLLATRGMTAEVVLPAADAAFVRVGGPPFAERQAKALYFGSVREELDIDALVALRRAGVEVDVIGRAENPALEAELAAGGVLISPPVPVDEIARVAAGYQVLVLPYRGERAASLMPAKFWNCAATGSWVVAQGLTLPSLPTVITAATTDAFVSAVRHALVTPPAASVDPPSWAARWHQVLGVSDSAAAGDAAARPRKRLLVVSSIRWEYLWQRHQALAAAAAEAGWDVDFQQPRRRSFRGLVPTLGRKLASAVRRRRGSDGTKPQPTQVPGVRVLGPYEPTADEYDVALVYVPFLMTERLLDTVRAKKVIYDAVVDWAAVPPDWHPPIGWRSSERRIARRHNAVVTTDATGMQRILAERGIPARVVFPAADPPFLRIAQADFDGRRARALYFGAVRDETDLDILATLHEAGIGVDIVGPVGDPAIQQELDQRGLTVNPPVPVDEVAALAGQYRVVLLPYRGARAGSIMPAKFWNCVASGAWVVTTGLAHTPDLPCVVRADRDTVVDAVRGAFVAPPDRGDAPLPSWGERWAEMGALVGL